MFACDREYLFVEVQKVGILYLPGLFSMLFTEAESFLELPGDDLFLLV